MRDLEDLARYELENTAVDFKAIQYTRERHEDFLKDVMAMANADVDGDRFVVLGIKLHTDGTRDVRGIPREEFRDPAEFQQLVFQNIEPDISLEYMPVEVDGRLVGVLRIHACDDPPYLMRKQYGSLQAGDGWIRKGSQQNRLARKDFERFALWRQAQQDLSAHIVVSFIADEPSAETTVASCGELALPSAQAAERIRTILAERSRVGKLGGNLGWGVTQNLAASVLGGPIPYEQRATETLEKDLEAVAATYRQDDLHHLFELSTQHLQIYIHNRGTAYVEDASIRLRFPRTDGLLLAKEVHHEPSPPRNPLQPYVPDFNFGIGVRYPDVEETHDCYQVSTHVGDVRHGLSTPVFEEELRVLLTPKLEGRVVPIAYQVFGKNLRRAVEGELTIRVVPPEHALP